MNSKRRPRWARRFYALALRLYPTPFRLRHEAEMLRVFEEGLRDAVSAGGTGSFRYAARIAADLAFSVARERLAAWEPRSAAAWTPALIVGAGAAYVDFRATEVQATLLVLLNGSFVVGWAQPQRVWKRAAAIAGSLPCAHVIAFAVWGGNSAGHPYWSRILIFLPAAAAALFGAYTGVCARRVAHRLA